MQQIIKQDKNIKITITYNQPSKEALKEYAHKLKILVDSNHIDFKEKLE